MDDKTRLELIADLLGGVTETARAMKLPTTSVTRRITGEIAIKDRDKQYLNLTVDDRVKQLLGAKWPSSDDGGKGTHA